MSVFHLSKDSSLKNSSDIEAVFKNGQKICSDPICLYYIKSSDTKMRVAFTVVKKSHKLACNRNSLKRLMKEAFRLNINTIISDKLDYNLLFVYFGSDKAGFVNVDLSIKSLLLSFKNKKLS